MKTSAPRRRSLGLLMSIVPLLVFSQESAADLCSLDPVPAATLLLPYFELDLAPGATDDVIITLNNAQDQAALVHATFWTDWAQPTFSFEIYLTGYDVLTLRLRPAFAAGNLPITADLQSDPTNTISPSPSPALEASFPNCQNTFPFYLNPVIAAANLARLRGGHTGQPIAALGNRCLGASHGDQVARGYLTFDSVSRCSNTFPSDPAAEPPYFAAGGLGIANNRNLLWGDYLLHDAGQADVVAHSLVHIEAGADLPSATGYTFYGSLPSAAGGVDQREPLGSIWGAANWRGQPHLLNTAITTATDLLVWRDPTAAPNAATVGFACGVGPDWAPLPQNNVYCFDEQESVVESCYAASCFPLATQRVSSGPGGVGTPFQEGWCLYDLGLENEGAVTGDVDFPGGLAQSHLVAVLRYDLLSSAGMPAVLLRGACEDPAPILFESNLFLDGFESGGTHAWSQVIP